MNQSQTAAIQQETGEATDLIGGFLQHNQEQHRHFIDPTNTNSRQLFKSRFQMEQLVLKCMDGRVLFDRWAGLPPGVTRSLRTMGGRFEAGTPLLRDRILALMDRAVVKGRCLLLITSYHFSSCGGHWGCRGFKEPEEARLYARELATQLGDIYGKGEAVHPLCVGMNTDNESFVFEGLESSEQFSIADQRVLDRAAFRNTLTELYPSMSGPMLRNLTEMAVWNWQHVQENTRPPCTEHMDHGEAILWFGDGSDFYRRRNEAIIIWPGTRHSGHVVENAAKIIMENIRSGRGIARGGKALVIGSVGYSKEGAERRSAEVLAVEYLAHALGIIHARVPELKLHLSELAGVIDERTRLFHPVCRASR